MICFAILAHKDEQALQQQIRNIRKYTSRDVKIVLYNGGEDRNFGKEVCKKENVMYCPYSRPLQSGKTGRFFYDVMRWLEDAKIRYDYLVYTEFDVLFVGHGFERFIQRHMEGYDCMGKLIRHETSPRITTWIPGKTMWREWEEWKPFFQRNDFYGTFNPMQVYRHGIIKRMLNVINKDRLERLLAKTNVYALGEMLYMTLAAKVGGKLCPYPKPSIEYLRVYNRIQLDDAKVAKRKSDVMFVHPVKDAPVRNWICDQ
ncbi:hypothetical protein [Paenibacillus sp. GP183]|jgi:hypothetical protein|uniref:hypothetical protein n=1 Tax=Paenibacillus sp. GP183 TaxID=1882751 RepID=UPI000899AD83|nr:hypothetical protein [Paenibacillus sp. GP183]SEC69720.1 hypothetical protein SAMN05443246_5036 [Paenibacillus sp. GP183]